MKRVHLELGGKAPMVVFDAADPEAVAAGIAMSSNVVAGHVRQPRCQQAATKALRYGTYGACVRTELAGGVFHVTMRGNARATIFHGGHDYDVFRRMLETTVEAFEWLLHSWCVLPNHFHLLVETPHANLGRGMLVLNGSYARRYNAKFDRVGHVFQTPYRSKPVASDEHFVESIRYIANNPVRAKLCERPTDWRWGSHRAMVGLDPKPSFLASERTLALVGSPAELAAFVDAKAMSRNVVAGHG